MKLEIYVDGKYEAECYCDVRLEEGDEILVPSRRRCGPGMEPEIVVATVNGVRHNLFTGVTIVQTQRVTGYEPVRETGYAKDKPGS